jgi:hypothetical protein
MANALMILVTWTGGRIYTFIPFGQALWKHREDIFKMNPVAQALGEQPNEWDPLELSAACWACAPAGLRVAAGAAAVSLLVPRARPCQQRAPPPVVSPAALGFTSILVVLNVYWYYLLLKGGYDLLRGGKKKKVAKAD